MIRWSVVLLVIVLGACKTDAPSQTAERVETRTQAPEPCAEWKRDWSEEATQTSQSSYWRPTAWRELSEAQTLEMVRPIFEQSFDDTKVLLDNHLLQLHPTNRIVSTAEAIALPDVTGNGHCDLAIRITPARVHSRDEVELHCTDGDAPLCAIRCEVFGSHEDVVTVNCNIRFQQTYVLFEGKEEGFDLIGQIGSIVDPLTKEVIVAERDFVGLLEESEHRFVFETRPEMHGTIYRSVYEDLGHVSQTYADALAREEILVNRRVYFRHQDMIRHDEIRLPHPSDKNRVFEVMVSPGFDGTTIFLNGLTIFGVEYTKERGHELFQLPPEYDLVFRAGNRLVAINGKPVSPSKEVFDRLHREIEVLLKGREPHTVCWTDGCETSDEAVAPATVVLTLLGDDGQTYQVEIPPPSKLEL